MGLFFKRSRKTSQSDIGKIVRDYELPSFQPVAIEALRQVRDPDCPVDDLAKTLELDPGLLIRVLRTVNSAAFGLAQKVDSIKHAINLLGRSRLETLILAVAVKDTLTPVSPEWFGLSGFWSASAMRASLARALSDLLHPGNRSECFIAGLLQDLAIPVLARHHGETYRKLYDTWRSDPSCDLHDLENDALGHDHSSIGALIAKEWNLPEHLRLAIEGHHHGCDDTELPPAVWIASVIRDCPKQDGTESVMELCSSHFAMDDGALTELVDQAREDAAEFVGLLN